jgi:hypothetical protein
LVATASGLAVAIPSQAAYYWFRSRIDRFRNLVEDTGERLFAVRAGRAFTQVASPPRPPPAPEPVNEALPVAAQGTP